ncbi:MAG TPA: acyl carrier protein [Flavisolibacter sp.]|nr:acyl carrier protein [Flavisolibacter sp.]
MPSNEEIKKQVNEIFKDVLDNDRIVIQDSTTADDIEEWDSLSHIQLIVGIEKHFKIRFTTAEVTSYKNVGEMIDGIAKKLEAKG